jgi:hypothetical protein
MARKNDKLNLPWLLAQQGFDEQLKRLMQSQGMAKVLAGSDPWVRTPLMTAAMAGHTTTCLLLLRHAPEEVCDAFGLIRSSRSY